jgi:N-methylhydantoinase B/oxoprolinase/acetone carboxylase alpha subunit
MPGIFGGFIPSQGDKLLLEREDGRGFGNPLELLEEMVLEDVRNGHVSTKSAWANLLGALSGRDHRRG